MDFNFDYEPIEALDPMAVMPSAAGLDIEVYEETDRDASVPCAQPQIYLRVDDLTKILYKGVPLVHRGGFKLVNKNAFAKPGERLAVSYGVVAHNVARIAQQNGEWEFVQSPCSVYGLGIKGNAGAKHTAFTPGGDPVGAPTFAPDNCVLSLLEDVDGVVAYNRYWVRPPYSQDCATKDAEGKSKDTRTPMSLKFWPGVVTDVPDSVKDKWVEFRTRLASKCAEVLGTAQASHPFEILVVGYSNQVDQIHKEGYEQGVLGITMNAWMIYIRPVHKNMEQKTNFAPFVSACERKADGAAFAARVKGEYLRAQTTAATKAQNAVNNNNPPATFVNAHAPATAPAPAPAPATLLSEEEIRAKLGETQWSSLNPVQKALVCHAAGNREDKTALAAFVKAVVELKAKVSPKGFEPFGLRYQAVLSRVASANQKLIDDHLIQNYTLFSLNKVCGAATVDIYKANLASVVPAAAPVAPVTPATTPVSDEAAAHVQQQQREEAATPATKQQEKPNGFSAVMNAVAKPVAQQEETPVTQEEATPPATPTDKETDWHPNPFGEVDTAEPTNIAEAKVVRSIPFSGKTTAAETTATASETTATPGQDLLGKMLSFFDNTETPQQLED